MWSYTLWFVFSEITLVYKTSFCVNSNFWCCYRWMYNSDMRWSESDVCSRKSSLFPFVFLIEKAKIKILISKWDMFLIVFRILRCWPVFFAKRFWYLNSRSNETFIRFCFSYRFCIYYHELFLILIYVHWIFNSNKYNDLLIIFAVVQIWNSFFLNMLDLKLNAKFQILMQNKYAKWDQWRADGNCSIVTSSMLFWTYCHCFEVWEYIDKFQWSEIKL
jgi:hypothetical protein